MLAYEAADEAGKSVAESILGEAGASYLSTFMTAYSAVMLAYLAIQLVYACEEEEISLMAKKELSSCTYLGSWCAQYVTVGISPSICIEKRKGYCCYNSPLSRIIQEQVRTQLGMGFGSAENPICGGIPVEDIQNIDWTKVNLDEWLGILAQNDVLPGPDDINLDLLTGTGSSLNLADDPSADDARLNSFERAKVRFEGNNIDDIRHQLLDSTTGYKGEPSTP